MRRQRLKQGLKSPQGKLPGWRQTESQNDTPDCNTSESQKQTLVINPRSDDIPINELWYVAYEKLRAEDGALIEEYEKKLQGNLVAGLNSMLKPT